ncbi:MAG: DUF2892 domain-containing protein [Candidatus Magasanikbacteria bacterium]|nr:DUF2892 domain-containing protein [Candidatus Magasanikbacteria bacterium]
MIFKTLYVLVIFLLSFLFGILYRRILKLFKSKSLKKRANHNIGNSDRLTRLFFAVILLIWGLYAWSPVILFFSGFCFYEAFSKWCGFYAILGKNTCQI